jgi:hypothetical protein
MDMPPGGAKKAKGVPSVGGAKTAPPLPGGGPKTAVPPVGGAKTAPEGGANLAFLLPPQPPLTVAASCIVNSVNSALVVPIMFISSMKFKELEIKS